MSSPGLQTRIEVFGDCGSAILENNKLVYLPIRGDEDAPMHDASSAESVMSTNPANSVGDTHVLQLQDFIDAIRQDPEPVINGEEGAKPLQIVLGAYESAAMGRTVYM